MNILVNAFYTVVLAFATVRVGFGDWLGFALLVAAIANGLATLLITLKAGAK